MSETYEQSGSGRVSFPPAEEEGAVLVLGIGNLLMGDEGVGVHAVRRLEEEQGLPAGTELLDGGTGTFYLLDAMQSARRIILIDASVDDEEPGTIQRLTPRYSSEYPPSLTAHDIGLKDLIDAFYLTGRNPRVVLYTVTVETLSGDLTLELSPPVAKVLPELCRRIREELAEEKEPLSIVS